ncbi:MAG: hypothetical protein ABI905_08370 [Betaproteobacteria bacterium]
MLKIAVAIFVLFALCISIAYFSWLRPAQLRHEALSGARVKTHVQVAAKHAPDGLADKVAARPTAPAPDATGTLEKIRDMLVKGVPEVCGMSEIEAALFMLSGTQSDKAATDAAIAVAAAQLAQSEKPGDKVLGLRLQSEQALANMSSAALERECGSNGTCRNNFRVPMQLRADAVEPLARYASQSPDFGVLATAAEMCQGITIGTCTALSFGAWAQREPDNAVPWLLAGMAAGARKDLAARDEAFSHVTINSRFEPRVLSRAALFQSPSVRAQSPLVQGAIAVDIVSTNAVDSITGGATALLRYCSNENLADPAKKASCEHLVESMLTVDQTTLSAVLAKSVGKRLGWSPARLQAMEDENDAVFGLMAESEVDGNPYSCASLARSNQIVGETLTVGERQWAQQQLKASGRTPAEVAAAFRPKLAAFVDEIVKRGEAPSKK